jgi:flavin-dependent dehydrogenase
MLEHKKGLFITNGSEIAIIGGGPAGSFFAKFAFDYARTLGIDIKVTIYNNRRFSEAGPKGCKGCVGVINERLNNKLKQHGIILPEDLIMQTIDGYCFVSKGGNLYVKKKTRLDNIITLFRGNGPFCSPLNGGLDGFLLEHAKNSGAKIIHEQVRDVIFPENIEDRIAVVSSQGYHKVDLLVGAFGIRSPIITKFKEVDYLPPETTRACLLEIDSAGQHVNEFIQNTIYIYSFGIHGIDYGIMIPKKRFLTVGIVGKDVRPGNLRDFLSSPLIKKALPENPKICCQCCTHIPVTNAINPFADRLLIIGDAGYSRYYKNGLESAFHSAQIAAKSAFDHGISKEAFENHYYPLCKKMFITENFYGRILFRMNSIISSNEILSMAHMDIARKDERKGHQHLDEIQWNMFTGHESYENIFWNFLEPKLQLELAIEAIRELLERIRKKCRLA